MTVNTISTYGSLQSFLQNINTTQNSLNNDEVQISSGYVSQTFDGLQGNVEQYVSLNAQIARLTNYQQGNSIITSQLQTTNTALSSILSVSNTLKSLMATQLSGTSSTALFTQQINSDRDALIGQLNTSSQGSYIFGGTNTNTPPVINPLPAPVAVGTPDTSYYQGAAQNTSFRITDGQTIDNTIRADDPAFQNIFAAIQLATKTGATTTDIANAENLLDTGIQGVIGLQATVNANVVRVQQVDTQNQSVSTYYQGLTDSMAKSDPVALSTKVAQDQTILQASFSAFARISSLSLSNYLK